MADQNNTEDGQWFFNPSTGEATEGKVAGWNNRMGPYKTKEEAENAFKIAQERNEAADEANEDDNDWGEPADWERGN